MFSHFIWVILNLHEKHVNPLNSDEQASGHGADGPAKGEEGGELMAVRQGVGSKDTTHQDLMRSSFLFLIKNTTFKMPHSFFVFIESKHRNFS